MEQTTFKAKNTEGQLVILTGKILQPGTNITRKDWFQKGNGIWGQCPSKAVGITLSSGLGTVWFRPEKVKKIALKKSQDGF